MQLYGLIGYPLSHSFSKRYFTEKFEKENIKNAQYELFELEKIEDVKTLLSNNSTIRGLNVTIPYKKAVIPYLDKLSHSAQSVGAVNVIKIDENGLLIGYNSDYYGFLQSLTHFMRSYNNLHSLVGFRALVLGTGGASQAVQVALKALNIEFMLVSRNSNNSYQTVYEQVSKKIMRNHLLIINTTPLGMYPKIDECPPLPYHFLTPEHLLYDLIYNPEITLFLKKGLEAEAKIKGGLEMLHLQAEKSWEIWNEM
jgi:shikimate dehydrogenase